MSTSNTLANTSNNDNINDIPCEFCDQLIDASEYEQHVISQHTSFSNVIRFNDEDLGVVQINIDNMLRNLLNFNVFRTSNYNALTSNDVMGGIDSLPFSNAYTNTSTINLFTIVTYDNVNESENQEEPKGVENISEVCRKVGSVPAQRQPSQDDMCAVCMELIHGLDNDDQMITLCQHFFCKKCITSWLEHHKTCPVCMTNLDELFKNLKSSS